jgi:predicted Zn-dependent peptidase
MLPTLALVAALAAAPDSLPSAPAASVVVHRQPAIPLVALRMAILADDPAGYAGAGHLVQHLLQPMLRDQVAVVGGQVQLQRTSDAVVFTVVGPAVELDYLAGVLRSALSPPRPSEAELLRASRELAEERLAEWETVDRHARSLLRARLFPNDLSAAGTEGGANRLMEEGAVRTAWEELYRPERVTVTAVGDVRLADVERAFAELPAAPPGRSAERLRDTLDLAPLAPAEATQGWLGLGYSGAEMDPAALSVAARVVGNQLRGQLPLAAVEAEHWWTHHGQAMVLLASVPGAEMQTAQRALQTALSRAEATLTASQVFEAAKAIRREMLFFARTPERMAEVLGQFTDRGGDPDAAQTFYTALERVGEEEVEEVLRTLLERTPVRLEIPPQKLTPR